LHHKFNIAPAAGCRDLGTLAERQFHSEITAAGNATQRKLDEQGQQKLQRSAGSARLRNP
jgi:hypothetical protein